jgi:hypothetical protein
MNFQQIEDEILRQHLYSIFRIKDEDYATTLKLMYIYHYVKQITHDPLGKISDMRQQELSRKHKDKLDSIFYQVQTKSLEKLSAPIEARVPKATRLVGIQKW